MTCVLDVWLLVVGGFNHGDFFEFIGLVKVGHFWCLVLWISWFGIGIFRSFRKLLRLLIGRIIHKHHLRLQQFKRPFPHNLIPLLWWYHYWLLLGLVLEIRRKVQVIKLVLWRLVLLRLEPGIFDLKVSEPVGWHGVDLFFSHVLINVLVERFLHLFEGKSLLLGLVVSV